MSLSILIIRELMHRKLGFAVALFSVIVAVGVLTAELTLLKAHDIQTDAILNEKREQLEEDMRVMEDDYRKIMKELGFNLLIFPKDQALDNFYAEGYASKTMPESFVTRLSESNIVTIRHLLPSLERKIRWPERGNRTIILIGTRGEVPFTHRDPKEPMLVAVPPSEIVLGYEIWSGLGLKTGDSIRLMGREFRVGVCHPQRGTKDDITAWIDLNLAQEMLDSRGKINAILALKCLCAGNDIELVRKDIAAILPETRVVELDNKVTIRAKARHRAKAAADSALAAEERYRAIIRRDLETFAAWLVPIVIIGSAALIGVLAFNNVHERRTEIGILRALGFRSGQILFVFLARAFLTGLLGGLAGYVAGFAVGIYSADLPAGATAAVSLFNPRALITIIAATPVLSSFAGWVPALMASRQDPATILSEE